MLLRFVDGADTLSSEHWTKEAYDVHQTRLVFAVASLKYKKSNTYYRDTAVESVFSETLAVAYKVLPANRYEPTTS